LTRPSTSFFFAPSSEDVDARDKPGHDDEGSEMRARRANFPLRPQTNFSSDFIAIAPVQSCTKKHFSGDIGKSEVEIPPSCPIRGALAIVANEGQGAVDARQRLTSAAVPGVAFWRKRALAYGEIDWVRRPDAGVNS
jgi:hypothetical protein